MSAQIAAGQLVLLPSGRTEKGAEPLLEQLRRVRDAGDIPLVGDTRWSAEHWARVRATVADARPHPGLAWAALTSGSSGTLKVVLRSAASWSDSFALIGALLGAGPGDVLAVPAPPVSSLTLFSLAHALDGGPAVALPHGHALDPADFAAATCFHGTPQALRTLLERGRPARLHSALVGGSQLDPSLRRLAEQNGVRVVSYYGAAELSFVALDQGDGLRPAPGVDIEVRAGELWVRSPFVAASYLHGPLRTDGEWVTVGDLADENDGVLTLRGRSDEAILTASATVIPEEVEATLRTLPGVVEAVVLGQPDPVLGAVLVAVIETDEARPVEAAELRGAATTLFAPSHRPRRWYVGVLPRTPSGKPARAATRELLRTGKLDRLG